MSKRGCLTGKFSFIKFKKLGNMNFNSKIDPLEELYRKPDPTLADGQNLTQMFGRFPPELLGKQIEDIDYYYRSKKVRNFIFIINRKLINLKLKRYTLR